MKIGNLEMDPASGGVEKRKSTLKQTFTKLITDFIPITVTEPSNQSSPSSSSSTGSWETTTLPDNSSSIEIFYDAPATPEPETEERYARDSIDCSRSDETDDADASWQNFPPPVELLFEPADTSTEIKSILEPSLERLRNRLDEERLLRAEHRRQEEERVKIIQILEKQSSAKGKAVEVGSVHQTSMNSTARENPYNTEGSVTSTQANWNFVGLKTSTNVNRLNGNSNSTYASTADSGYISGTTDGSSTNAKLGKGTGLRAIFKRPISTFRKVDALPSSNVIKECVSCLDDFDSNQVVHVGCHDYCKSCFQTLIDTAITAEEHWPPKCCLNEIPSAIILPQLDIKKQKKYKDILAERLVPAGDRIYCSKTSCSVWISPRYVDKAQSCASCPSCRRKTCTSCRGEYHKTGECPTDPAQLATMQLAYDEGWRRCYSCHAMVEHNEGCMHMTCTCKASFCYVCGAKWRTCTHGLEPPPAYLAEMQARKAAALARDQAARAATLARDQAAREEQARQRAAQEEADELHEILQQIEDFETREAIRLASESEALRVQEEIAKQQREERRIQATMAHFQELNNELEFVHALQRVAMVERYEEQLVKIDRENRAWEAMEQRHSTEILLTETESQAKISESEYWFDVEYHERLARERKIEDDYVTKLTAYWWDKPEGKLRIEEGRNKLRELHAKAYKEWDAVCRADHEATVRLAKARVSLVQTKIAREIEAMGERTTQTEADIRRNADADSKWMDMVATERFEMLQSMEQAEYARVGK